MDKIGDLVNRIATANPNAKEIRVPNSKYRQEILKVLYEEGWIAGVTEVSEDSKKEGSVVKELKVFLKRPYIDGSNVDWTKLNPKVLRISKPGRRLYYTVRELTQLKAKGTTLASTMVVSTPKGVMTLTKAVALNLGGELLFKVTM